MHKFPWLLNVPPTNLKWPSSLISPSLMCMKSLVYLLSHVRLCSPMDCSMPGFLVHHQLPKLAQTHVHWVSDAMPPSHPLSSPSPPAFNLSQNQGLFQWEGSSHQCGQSIGVSVSASDLPVNIQGWFPLLLTGFISLQSKGVVKSPLQYHSPKASILRHSVFFYCPAVTSVHDYWKNHSFDYKDLCQQRNVSAF